MLQMQNYCANMCLSYSKPAHSHAREIGVKECVVLDLDEQFLSQIHENIKYGIATHSYIPFSLTSCVCGHRKLPICLVFLQREKSVSISKAVS